MMTEEELENLPAVNLPAVSLSGNKELTITERKEAGLLKAGITDAVVFDVAFNGLTATKKVEEYDEQGNVRVVERPDHIVRHKYLDSILRVKGYIRPDAAVDNTINFNLTVEAREAIRGRLRRVIDI